MHVYDRDGELVRTGKLASVSGFWWHPREHQIAITAGKSLYLWEFDKNVLHKAVDVFEKDVIFIADPHFLGDQVVFTAYKNLGQYEQGPKPDTPPPGQEHPAGDK